MSVQVDNSAPCAARGDDRAGQVSGAVVRYVVAPDGRDRIDFIGGACESTLGVSPAALRDSPAPLWAQVVPEDLAAMRDSIRDSARDLTRWLHRWRVIAPDGRRKWLEGQGQPVRLPDGGTRWDSLILDVTEFETLRNERARTAAELRVLRARLDRIGRARMLGTLAAALPHEIRQPLAALTNYLRSAAQLLADAGPEAAPVRELVARAEDQAGRAAGIVARIEALFTNGATTAAPTDLNALLAEAIDTALAGTDPSLVVIRDFATGLAPLSLDRLQIRQVMVNLLRNAREALAGQAAPRLVIRTEAIPGGARLSVEDNGPGVPEALRAHLFEPFVTGREDGIGIGLAISAAIVAANGGRIALEPVPTGGARFVVELPSAALPADFVPAC